jgi:cGMP-dependent protein kinase
MKKIQFFRHSSDQRIMEICKNMKKENFLVGDKIFEEGATGNKLYLIKKGKVRVYKNNKFLRELEEGNCFGEVSLLVNEPRSATIVAESNLKTYTLSYEDFINFIDKKMLEFLVKKIALQDDFSIKLKDLYYLKNLGRGKFGSVSLVHNKINMYAIKAVNRKAADKQKILIKYFLEERKILLTLDHPFIMKLVRTFKNDDFIFYLLEYIPGIVLSRHLEDRDESKLKQKYQFQFYTALLLLIIDYLNAKFVCHRDIKPDNIMIDDKGYLKLIDFGTSIIIKDFTTTITGTPHYIAPEVIEGRGYSYSCDYWSIGIVGYEIYYNIFPFGNNAEDPMHVYRDIVRKYFFINIKGADFPFSCW